MKHRDRVLTALGHEEPDRCPMQISFTPEFAARLRADVKLEDLGQENPLGAGSTYELERLLEQDMLLASVGWANSYYGEGASYTDPWGVGWKSVQYETKFGTGRYTEIASHPLADDARVEAYQPPDPTRPGLYADAEKLIAGYKGEYWIIGATVTTIFETAWALRGLSRLMMDFIVAPDLAHRILDVPYRYHLTAAKRLVELGVDMIWLGDDVGTQNGMMISPAHWQTFLKPRMAELISTLKRINPSLKVAYHSDGDVSMIIPELIEIGVDVLNPLQPACMDLDEINTRYGTRLCFWGSLDEQRTLPFGSPDDVRREVLDRLETLGQGGGLMIGPTHHVQLDTPMENFWAMVDTIRHTRYSEIGRYGLG